MYDLNAIKMILFDIDGVITDGKRYTNGKKEEFKSIALKDLDAISLFKEAGYKLGCITGEDTAFSRQFVDMRDLDFVKIGCKLKMEALEEVEKVYRITSEEICYIGDGKYDVPVLNEVGCAVCPNDAIAEAKRISDVVLERKGGEGCIAELYTRFHSMKKMGAERSNISSDILDVIKNDITAHCAVTEKILEEKSLLNTIGEACQRIVDSYQNGKRLLLCGNGGSAADAQHLAAELVGRFYLERKAYAAEALSTNVSIITALANDYDYNMVFSRQVEAKGEEGDVLIGITTSGKSENIFRAFKQAKENGMYTVLLTGRASGYLPITEYTDYAINIPSDDTPRIQEGHILVGHIMCEIIEAKLTGGN